MERVIRADLHAFAAADTARQEVRFIEGPGRTNAPIAFFHREGSGRAHQRNNGNSGGEAGEDLAAFEAGSFKSVTAKKELKFQAVVRAFPNAIQTKMTFGFAPGNTADRVVATLAAKQAAIAVVAGDSMLLQPEDGPAREETEQGSQGA